MRHSYTVEFINLFNSVLNKDDVPDEYVNDILNRLSFIKPLRGTMKRNEMNKNSVINVEFNKNFHDEQEWRYVPNANLLFNAKLERVIANPHMLSLMPKIVDVNKSLEMEQYRHLWLEYNYDDIRYIVVPNTQSRIDIIKVIMSIPNKQFSSRSSAKMQRYILISKILVLDEIKKDW